jgi:rod shape determining protein RodA
MLYVVGSMIIGGVLISFSVYTFGAVLVVSSLIVATYAFYHNDNWKRFVLIVVAAATASGIFTSVFADNIYNALPDHQKERIEVFINPDESVDDKAFNVTQSKVAIGSGQIMGKGFGFGTQSRLNFLPEHKTDFIFGAYAEQFGLVGSIVLISLYFILIFRILWIAFTTHQKLQKDTFASMLMVGLAFKILTEVFISLGSNLGIIPATGIPLPLMSAGGTITIMTFVSLGLIQSIVNRNAESIDSTQVVDNKDLLI